MLFNYCFVISNKHSVLSLLFLTDNKCYLDITIMFLECVSVIHLHETWLNAMLWFKEARSQISFHRGFYCSPLKHAAVAVADKMLPIHLHTNSYPPPFQWAASPLPTNNEEETWGFFILRFSIKGMAGSFLSWRKRKAAELIKEEKEYNESYEKQGQEMAKRCPTDASSLVVRY